MWISTWCSVSWKPEPDYKSFASANVKNPKTDESFLYLNLKLYKKESIKFKICLTLPLKQTDAFLCNEHLDDTVIAF